VEEGCTWDANPGNTVLNLKPAFWNQTAAGASPLDKAEELKFVKNAFQGEMEYVDWVEELTITCQGGK